MHPSEMLAFIKETVQANLELMEKKNRDYGASVEDAFANFTAVETMGIPTEVGFLTRMMDKMMRISSFVQNGELQVKDESVADTLNDLSNYSLLFLAYLESQRRAQITENGR